MTLDVRVVTSLLSFFLSFFLCDSRDVLLEEVDADGLLVVLGEDALAVALYHARLAHRPVPHYHNLEGEEEGEMKLDDVWEGAEG